MLRTSAIQVLVVDTVDSEATKVVRALADFGYTNIIRRSTIEAAVEEIKKGKSQLVVTDLELGEQDGCELTRAIRESEHEDYVYVIMLAASGNRGRLREAFTAGVDDFIEKPFRADEIVARARAGERIIELESRLRTRSRELEVALRRIDVAAAQRALAKAQVRRPVPSLVGGEGLEGLLALPPWTQAGELLAQSLGDFFQLPTVAVPPRDDYSTHFVADVLLSEPGRQLAIGISVLADDASMKAMALQLLGDADDEEGAKALVLEVGNIMMGAFKTAFVANGHSFTGGIPVDLAFEKARATLDAHPVRHRIAFTCGDAHVEVWLRATEKANARVKGKDLIEGLVVGSDIIDPKGILIAHAGTRLSGSIAERIAKVLPDIEFVVGNASAALAEAAE
jgi:CheY-like chemotaxis protein